MSLLRALPLLLLLTSLGCRQANPEVELLESELRWMEDQVYLLDEQLQQKMLELESCRRSNASLKNLLAVQQQSPRAAAGGASDAAEPEVDWDPQQRRRSGGANRQRTPSGNANVRPRLRQDADPPTTGEDRPRLDNPLEEPADLPEPDLPEPNLPEPGIAEPGLSEPDVPAGAPQIELGPESSTNELPSGNGEFAPEDLAPPSVDLGNGSDELPGDVPGEAPAADAPGTDGAQPNQGTQLRRRGAPRSRSARGKGTLRRASANSGRSAAVQLDFNGRLTGGYDHDGRPGDDGIMVLLQVQPGGEIAREYLGPLELELRDPRPQAGYKLVSRWDFDASTVTAHYGKTLFGEGVHLEVPWETVPACSGELELVARMLTEDGRRLTTSRKVMIHPPGIHPPAAHPLALATDPELALLDAAGRSTESAATSPEPARPAPGRPKRAVPAGWDESAAWTAERPRPLSTLGNAVPAEPSLLPDVLGPQ